MADDKDRLQSLTETLANIDAVRRQREALHLGPSAKALAMLGESAARGAATKIAADQQKAMGETTRQTLERVVAQSGDEPRIAVGEATNGAVNVSEVLPPLAPESLKSERKFWSYIDKGVLSLFEVLALLFALPFGDALFHDKPVTNLYVLYLVIGCLFAIGGPMFPLTRTVTWIPRGIAPSISAAARDARTWIAVLLIFFLYGVAPDIYRRATAPVALTTDEIATVIAPIKAKLDAANRQLQEKITPLPPEGPVSGKQVVNDLRDLRAQIDELKRQNDDLRQAAQLSTEEPRIYTNKKVLDFAPTQAGVTDLQAVILASDEKGKWMKIDGKVRGVAPNMVLTLAVDEKGQVRCVFDQKWGSKLAILRQGDKIIVTGKIREYFGGDLMLEACEIL